MPGPESRMPRHAVCGTSDASAARLRAETYFTVSARPGTRLAAMKKTDPTQRAAKRPPPRSTAATGASEGDATRPRESAYHRPAEERAPGELTTSD